MSTKLLVNGIAGAGKTKLLKTLGDETFVISRDAKEFTLPIPHTLVTDYEDMNTFLYGKDTAEGHQPGIYDKLAQYIEAAGKPPKIVVFDSVSQIFMDVIESAADIDTAYGKQGSYINKEIALLVKFIHEQLEVNGVTVVLLNHVIEEKVDMKPTGGFVPFGQGKFLAKGGFYSTVNESITIVPEGMHRVVYTRGTLKQARTALTDLPDKMYVENIDNPDKSKKLNDGEEYFELKKHIERLWASQENVKKFRF